MAMPELEYSPTFPERSGDHRAAFSDGTPDVNDVRQFYMLLYLQIPRLH